MDLPPFGKKQLLLVVDKLHSAAQIVRLHVFGPDKGWQTVRPDQVYFGLTVPEHMHMSWLVVVGKDDDAQTVRPVDRDHD
jgi:hypothetical protein